MAPWLRYTIGILIAIHGYVYIPFAFYLVNEFQRSYGASRLLRPLLEPAGVRTTTLAIHAAAGALLLAGGLLIVFAPGAVPVWRILAVTGGAAGVLAFAVAWNGRPTHLGEQGILGATASLFVVVAALTLGPRVT